MLFGSGLAGSDLNQAILVPRVMYAVLVRTPKPTDVWPTIIIILWMHEQGITSLTPNQSIKMLPKLVADHLSCRLRFVRI